MNSFLSPPRQQPTKVAKKTDTQNHTKSDSNLVRPFSDRYLPTYLPTHLPIYLPPPPSPFSTAAASKRARLGRVVFIVFFSHRNASLLHPPRQKPRKPQAPVDLLHVVSGGARNSLRRCQPSVIDPTDPPAAAMSRVQQMIHGRSNHEGG